MRLALLTLTLASLSLGLQAAPKRTSKRSHPARQAAGSAAGSVHVIKKGETAAQVARANQLSLAELAQLNPTLRLSKLAIGMKLKVRAVEANPNQAHQALQALQALAPSGLAPTPRQPLQPVPQAPAFASTPMPHLEQLLPYQIRISAPGFGLTGVAQSDPNTRQQLLSRIQSVMPPMTEAEYKALLPIYAPADPDRLDLIWPVETRTISSGWGPRMRTRTVRVKNQRKKRVRYRGRHRGLDLNAPTGTAVFAALDGEVIVAGRHKQYGNYVVVAHGNGVVTLYAHHSLNLVQPGDIVRRGQKIAEVGRTGNATGPHLHFELKVDGIQRNPLPVLNDEEEIPAELATLNAMVGSGAQR